LVIYTGNGNDVVNLSGDTNTLDPILGNVTINGGGPNVSLVLGDSGNYSSENYTVGYGTVAVGRLPNLQLAFTNLATLAIDAGASDDTFTLNNPSYGLQIDLDGGPGYDTAKVVAGNVSNLQLTSVEALQILGGTLNQDAGHDLAVQ